MPFSKRESRSARIAPEDKTHRLVDKDAVKVVQEIFRLYVQVYGVSQIAKEITKRHIMNLTVHAKANGINPPDNRRDVGIISGATARFPYALPTGLLGAYG